MSHGASSHAIVEPRGHYRPPRPARDPRDRLPLADRGHREVAYAIFFCHEFGVTIGLRRSRMVTSVTGARIPPPGSCKTLQKSGKMHIEQQLERDSIVS